MLSSADKIRQKNKNEKQSKADDESFTWWQGQLTELKNIKTPRERGLMVESLFRNKKCQEGWCFIEVRLYRLHAELQTWIDDPAKEDADVRDRYTVSIMRMVKGLYDRKRLSTTAQPYLEKVLIALGFATYVDSLSAVVSFDEALDRPLSFDFVKLIRSKTGKLIHDFMPVTEDPVLWQLRLFGDYMDRSMDSQVDDRVHFDPDGWQRDVLDCLDADKSVLVVGQYFNSFYPACWSQLPTRQRRQVQGKPLFHTMPWRRSYEDQMTVFWSTLRRQKHWSTKWALLIILISIRCLTSRADRG